MKHSNEFMACLKTRESNWNQSFFCANIRGISPNTHQHQQLHIIQKVLQLIILDICINIFHDIMDQIMVFVDHEEKKKKKKKDYSGILPSLIFEMKLQEDEGFQRTWVGYGFLQTTCHLAQTTMSSLHGCSTWSVLFSLFHARMLPSTKLWLALLYLGAALALLYLVCFTWWSVKHSPIYYVNCPNSEKTHAFLKKLWEGIKATVIIQGTLLAGSLESGQVTVQI